jgi:cyclin-dependent kinase 7
MGAKLYSYAVDIWSAACIFAELMLRVPFLAGSRELEQLDLIFKALGTPTEADWPGMSSLPDCIKWKDYGRTPLRTLFTGASEEGIDLLEKMFTYDPAKRPSAEEALEHPYFVHFPPPSRPEKLPKPCIKPVKKRAFNSENAFNGAQPVKLRKFV